MSNQLDRISESSLFVCWREMRCDDLVTLTVDLCKFSCGSNFDDGMTVSLSVVVHFMSKLLQSRDLDLLTPSGPKMAHDRSYLSQKTFMPN